MDGVVKVLVKVDAVRNEEEKPVVTRGVSKSPFRRATAVSVRSADIVGEWSMGVWTNCGEIVRKQTVCNDCRRREGDEGEKGVKKAEQNVAEV